jgi:hypothetical protein
MTSYEQISGGGTGGGTGMDDDGNNLQSAGATYQIAGNQVVLLSRKAMPPGKPGPSVITILAAGLAPTFADDGYVDVRGTKGVRVTTGSPLMIPLGASPGCRRSLHEWGRDHRRAKPKDHAPMRRSNAPAFPKLFSDGRDDTGRDYTSIRRQPHEFLKNCDDPLLHHV